MKGTRKSPQAKGWETRRKRELEELERVLDDQMYAGTAKAEGDEPMPPVVTPPPSHTLVGMTNIAGTHRVSLGFTAQAPGATIVVMGISEARLLAKSLLDWAQLAEDHNDGRTR